MNLLIKDDFFSNPDVLRKFALDCDYIDSEEVKVDVGWRGYRTDEFEVIDNEHLIIASEKIRQAVCEHFDWVAQHDRINKGINFNTKLFYGEDSIKLREPLQIPWKPNVKAKGEREHFAKPCARLC